MPSARGAGDGVRALSSLPFFLVLALFLGGSLPRGRPYMVKDINPGGASVLPTVSGVAGRRFFIRADDGVNGKELWVSDGTSAGTRMVIDITPGPGPPTPGTLTSGGSVLFFSADDGAAGYELWSTDGTERGTGMVVDIHPSGDAYPSGGPGLVCEPMTNTGGTVLFAAYDGTHGRELWKSDGTEQGTMLVKDIWPGSSGSGVMQITDVNGVAFFAAYTQDDPVVGYDLWKSDGTEEGTVRVKDLSGVLWLTPVNGLVFFQGGDDSGTGWELWVSDGTEQGTHQVKDINPGPYPSSPLSLTAVGGALYFSAYEPVYGRELWRSDGTPEGTYMVKDINPTGSGGIGHTAALNGMLFFAGYNEVYGRELWKSDGTEEGTVMVKDINPTGGSEPEEFEVVAGVLYFSADDGVHGRELWRSDGTDEGTFMVMDIYPGPEGCFPYTLTDVEGRLFFSAYEPEHSRELWVFDPTPIPAVSSWGLAALGALVLLGGAWIIHRRKGAAAPRAS